MKKTIKRIVFALVIVLLLLAIGVIIKTGKFDKLEGYMYSFATEITNAATDCNATSSNATSSDAQGCATSSNATSSDAQGCATSGNATSSDVQDCATSSNVQSTETIKVTNTNVDTNIKSNTELKEIETNLIYNNSEITPDILEKISKATETQSITINLDSNVNISEDIFEAIQGKEIILIINDGENQIIFNGKTITMPKDINAEISYNLVNEDEILKEIVQEGVVINFANNGELPAMATIRIKVTDEIKQYLNMKTIYVYHYDEQTKELKQMSSNAIYNEDGFIEFSINHNSKYLLVNNIIEEKEYNVIIGEDTDIKTEVSFLESHKMYIMIIGVSILAIVIVTIILIIDKNGIAKRKAKANNNEEK